MKKSKLLGCPICGCQPRETMVDFPDEPEPYGYVCYRDKHLVSASGTTKDAAAACWNTRVEKSTRKL